MLGISLHHILQNSGLKNDPLFSGTKVEVHYVKKEKESTEEKVTNKKSPTSSAQWYFWTFLL